LTEVRAAHQREGHERFTLDRILAEEKAVLDLADAQEPRSMLWIKEGDTAGLSADQKQAVENIGAFPWLVQPLSAPAGAGKTTSMRALVSASHRKHYGTTLVLAPTGKAVDVAVWEGAGDRGYTVAKALQLIKTNELELNPATLVIVDEAGMIGTDDLRQLLRATTSAGAKTVLIGDEHQLAPVKARGGMFAQLCADLPWTQHLSEVWRMCDREERAASLAVRDGTPTEVRKAVDWYRDHDRLHSGDPVAMAADALDAYRADVAAGKDALLVCSTTEMTDALNERLHRENLGPSAQTVAGARGHRIAVGDLVLTRSNDPTIGLEHSDRSPVLDRPVRNGNRWRVAGIDPATNRLAAVRVDDGARTVFESDYVRGDVSLGYAVTVHSAQGATADTAHAVLGDNTTRSLLYVAISRGREANTVYLYENATEAEHGPSADGASILGRGDRRQSAGMLYTIALHKDARPTTALDLAAETQAAGLSAKLIKLLDFKERHLTDLRENHEKLQTAQMQPRRTRYPSRGRSIDNGVEL
jgi:ATP-dependent exoDNAse (exonuclease V) alpha subunit